MGECVSLCLPVCLSVCVCVSVCPYLLSGDEGDAEVVGPKGAGGRLVTHVPGPHIIQTHVSDLIKTNQSSKDESVIL